MLTFGQRDQRRHSERGFRPKGSGKACREGIQREDSTRAGTQSEFFSLGKNPNGLQPYLGKKLKRKRASEGSGRPAGNPGQRELGHFPRTEGPGTLPSHRVLLAWKCLLLSTQRELGHQTRAPRELGHFPRIVSFSLEMLIFCLLYTSPSPRDRG